MPRHHIVVAKDQIRKFVDDTNGIGCTVVHHQPLLSALPRVEEMLVNQSQLSTGVMLGAPF